MGGIRLEQWVDVASAGGQEEGGVLCRTSNSSCGSVLKQCGGVFERVGDSDRVGNKGSGSVFQQLWCKQDIGWNDVC